MSRHAYYFLLLCLGAAPALSLESYFALPEVRVATNNGVLVAPAQAGETLTRSDARVFSLHPYDGAQELNGYRIGRYPPPPDGRPGYQRPQGLIEVTPHNRNAPVSTHFVLGDFLCKQTAGWPRYVALQRPLLERLEQIAAMLAARGYAGASIVIMSGYRTPAYNAGLGNVANSRHIYGDAADIYIDADGDGRMDDLDGNGRLDVDDALTLARWIDNLDAGALLGGLAAYPPTHAHGGFVHVDTRGYRARWGHQPH